MGETEEKIAPSGDMQSEGEETTVFEGEVIESETQREDDEDLAPSQEADLKEALEEAEQRAAEYLDGWQRAQAAFSNYRKRIEAEKREWRTNAVADFAMRLLPVLDDFERAFLSVPETLKDAAWTQGIALILRKLSKALESEDIRPFTVEKGEAFDPMYHQAVSYQAAEGLKDGQIVTAVQKGYRLGDDRVLRPAFVVVAKSPERAISGTESVSVKQARDVEDASDPVSTEGDGEGQGEDA
jgi:molecular chaperone GrpE